MADTERREVLSGKSILNTIMAQAKYHATSPVSLFSHPGLKTLGAKLSEQLKETGGSKYAEWRNFRSSVVCEGEDITIHALPGDVARFRKALQKLERVYKRNSLVDRDLVLQDMVLLGQEILRRRYFGLLVFGARKVDFSPAAAQIVETGAGAVQVLGRSPAGPRYPYWKFLKTKPVKSASLGVEILSSGAFPDWSNHGLASLRKRGEADRAGFENVIEAVLDSPRARVLRKLLDERVDLSPLVFPLFLRTMLDLELMRLGQATTPGTYHMLLNSSYHGALLVDHSTNVSEQVQIIHEEENWKPAFTFKPSGDPAAQALEAAKVLLGQFFRFKRESLIGRDHPREARIEFSADADPVPVERFFRALMVHLKKGITVEKKKLPSLARVHSVVPVVRLADRPQQAATVRKSIDLVKRLGFGECFLMADFTRHDAGLLQYFATVDEANKALEYARTQHVALKDGRTVDMVATANKAIEAAAGAIESGQGCIKIGLLGLTFEQMKEFIGRVKNGLGGALKRQENQLLVFIGIIDRPMVTAERITAKPSDVAMQFVALMKSTRHDILLIDTMNKGATDKRLLDAGDGKGGHLTTIELNGIIRDLHAAKCDAWVAGSYTEEQVYRSAMEAADVRPDLICLGGAERSSGGLRLDPREAFEPEARSKEDALLAAKVEHDADIKFILSRENKLARDAGHVVGELRRRGMKEAKQAEAMRVKYLTVRKEYFDALSDLAKKDPHQTRNIDTLVLKEAEVLRRIPTEMKKRIAMLRKEFEEERERYVEFIAERMLDLFRHEWIQKQASDE